jgi:hypothetical protein
MDFIVAGPAHTNTTNENSELKVFCGDYVTNQKILDEGRSTDLGSTLALPSHHRLLPRQPTKEVRC